ncbi:hypothetical protein TRL7639_03974 [Falsiruegeria litorea R37]|uniref:Uncharacterized protein n=1 Tax=Falsiruegeria litorea R37 TaxID=1200284 RepID=A0A1Y5TNU4_9RHOB|nr:hypothetical protein [Falsiruegeria litorea]SLN68380.1 hypothetical protein TRL7639_03974 [Falsiruegeria litorea R37]
MTNRLTLLGLGQFLLWWACGALAQSQQILEIDSLLVDRTGRVVVTFELHNTSDRPVCVPTKADKPLAFVEQFHAFDNLQMRRAENSPTGIERFRATYLVVDPGQSLTASTTYSAHDFRGFSEQIGQVSRSPQVEKDPLYVILLLALRNCPLVRHSGSITFNGGWHNPRMLRSLPSRVFSLRNPGRY